MTRDGGMEKLTYAAISLGLRGGSRGRVQVVRPLPPEMTCGFLIQLVFCKKNYVVNWC